MMTGYEPRQDDSLGWGCRLTLRGLAASFAVAGTFFLFLPDETVQFLNVTGAWFGNFTPAPASTLRFWLTLSTGYMVLVTALAVIAQSDLKRHRNLVALLSLGKATTSLASLAFFVLSLNAFIYLANFLVDGAITLMALAVWLAIPTLGETDARESIRVSLPESHSGEPIIDAVLEAMVPAGGPFEEGAAGTSVATDVEGFIAGVGPSAPRAFRAALRVFEYSPFFLPPFRLRRFSHLPLGERVRLLHAWEESWLMPRRQAIHTLKLLVMTQFYARAAIEERLGYPHPLDRVPRPEAVQGHEAEQGPEAGRCPEEGQ